VLQLGHIINLVIGVDIARYCNVFLILLVFLSTFNMRVKFMITLVIIAYLYFTGCDNYKVSAKNEISNNDENIKKNTPQDKEITDDYKISNKFQIDNKQFVVKTSNNNYNYLLNFGQFKTLYEKQWLLNEVIDFYKILLRNKYGDNGVFILNTMDSHDLIEDDENYIEFPLFKGLFDSNIILIPDHINRNHWILNVIELDKKNKLANYYYIDSFGKKLKESNYELELQRITKFFNKLVKDFKVEYTLITKHEVFLNRLQNNGYDCGAFLCAFIRNIKSTNKFDISELNKITEENMNNFRKLMRKEMLEGEIDTQINWIDNKFTPSNLSDKFKENFKIFNTK
jgi:Ulp1 family protease